MKPTEYNTICLSLFKIFSSIIFANSDYSISYHPVTAMSIISFCRDLEQPGFSCRNNSDHIWCAHDIKSFIWFHLITFNWFQSFIIHQTSQFRVNKIRFIQCSNININEAFPVPNKSMKLHQTLIADIQLQVGVFYYFKNCLHTVTKQAHIWDCTN